MRPNKKPKLEKCLETFSSFSSSNLIFVREIERQQIFHWGFDFSLKQPQQPHELTYFSENNDEEGSDSENQEIEVLSASSSETFVLFTTDQGLFFWGHFSSQRTRVEGPEFVPFSTQVLGTSCGLHHALILCEDGLYSWGLNENGQLGLGEKGDCTHPERIEFFESGWLIRAIACGSHHCIVLSSFGMFSWGSNMDGQLGIDPPAYQIEFAQQNMDLEADPMALFRNGYIWQSSDDFFELHKPHSTPQRISIFDEMIDLISDISCTEESSFAIVDKRLFVWGSNQYGQLGIDEEDVESPCRYVSPPISVPFFEDQSLLGIACGGHHIFGYSTHGLFSWGCGFYGQLGFEDLNDRSFPTFLSMFGRVYGIFCGRHHSVLISPQGVFSFGRNGWGQLANSSSCFPQEVSFFDSIIPSLLKFKPSSFRLATLFKSYQNQIATLLLLARKFCPSCLFYQDYFPLDLLKFIFKLSNL